MTHLVATAARARPGPTRSECRPGHEDGTGPGKGRRLPDTNQVNATHLYPAAAGGRG